MVFFHLKKNKREKLEDKADEFRMADYGLDIDDLPTAGIRQKHRMPDPPQPSHGDDSSDHPSRSPPRSQGARAAHRPPGAGRQQNGHLNPFVSDDDSVSVSSMEGPHYPDDDNKPPPHKNTTKSEQDSKHASPEDKP